MCNDVAHLTVIKMRAACFCKKKGWAPRFYSIAGSIVRWVLKGITILKNWPAETGIGKQLASLGRSMQRVIYTA